MNRTLYEKLWDSHLVREESDGTGLLYIDRHVVHEVTSPQAFEGLEVAHRKPWRIDSVLATADHNVPTTPNRVEMGIADPISRLQVETLDQNVDKFHVKTYFGMKDKRQGIVHVIAPEQGAVLPGMTVVCGDSHTSTNGAFAALAFGIGLPRSSTCSPRRPSRRRNRSRCWCAARGRCPRASRPRTWCSRSSARSARREAPAARSNSAAPPFARSRWRGA
jgi:hypothetical protein